VNELRRDPLSGRVVAIAPGRATRPGASSSALIEPVTESELADCPFCAGREDRTPPEVLRIGDPWHVRVVPNLYPAVDRQEVVIHSPRHVRSFAELTDDEISRVAEAWQRLAARADGSEFTYLHVLINEGRAAGSSLPHSHSQVVYLREPPPAALAERRDSSCPVCEVLSDARADLELGDDNGTVAVVHPAGRLPYESLIAGPHPEFDLAAGLRLLRGCVQALHAVEGTVAWNAWLHNAWQSPSAANVHPHIEWVPRLTVLAGLELGAEIYVNTLAPDEAASRPSGVPEGRRAWPPFWSRKRRAASIAAPRFSPLSFPCLISITVSTASMS
jgi:UDPglucose--hexose-1-phosphate uridylyltransferase